MTTDIQINKKLRRRVSFSFSGGKTSAMMTIMMVNELRKRGHEVVVVFANTGKEHDETLDFIRRCDEIYNLGTVWIEAVVHHGKRKSCTHKVVDFKTAARDGEPFEDVIRKYGLPNQVFNLCNRELKLNPMRSFLRSLGWKANTYSTAVGIRIDEIDRMSLPSMAAGVFYPCIDNEITKADVREFWLKQPTNLNIPEHYGNCVTCFKKSDRKLMTIAQDDESVFEWAKRMDDEYSEGFAGGLRHMFRGNRTTEELLHAARTTKFNRFNDQHFEFDPDLDLGGGCGSSCEIGAEGAEWGDDEVGDYEPEFAEPELTEADCF